jgi:hypothetical protein
VDLLKPPKNTRFHWVFRNSRFPFAVENTHKTTPAGVVHTRQKKPPCHGTKRPDLSAGSTQKIEPTCRTYREEKPTQKIVEVAALNLVPSNVTRGGSA